MEIKDKKYIKFLSGNYPPLEGVPAGRGRNFLPQILCPPSLSPSKGGQFLLMTFLLFLFFLSPLSAQINLKINPLDTTPTFFKKYNLVKEYPDSLTARTACHELILNLKKENYLTASLDGFEIIDSQATAKIYLGAQLKWAYLKTKNIPSSFLSKEGFRKGNFEDRPFNLLKINELKDGLLEQFENNGYPFAQVLMDSVVVNGGAVTAVLKAETGPLIYFEKLKDFGEVEISQRYLENYLGIEENQPFNRSKVLKIQNRIKELPFLTEEKPLKIDFLFNRAEVKLALKPKKASRFDFVIGVLPNNQELNRLLITGHFVGEFQNQFGKGERLFVELEQLRPQSPQMEMEFQYPYFLDSPFGVDMKFHLYKRDTTFLDVNFELGASYLLEGGNYLKVFFNQYSSRLLSVNEANLLQTRQLPAQLDVSRSNLGVEWLWQKLDYRFNPRKGWETKISTAGGLKTIRENSLILGLSDFNFEFESLYDSLQLNSFQGQVNLELARYFPTTSNQTLKLGLKSFYTLSANPILKNEQQRIGGNQLLRGFDEESIFATNMAVATAEYRLLTGQNSYLFSFLDLAWVEDKTTQTNITDTPLGFGAGITFDTSVGIFGMSYALGRQLGNSIDFRAGKIHFGYLSLF